MVRRGPFLHTHRALVTFALVGALPLAANAGDASPAPATASSAASVAGSPFVDYYTATRPGADAEQTLILRLRGDGIASMRTSYSLTQTAAGTPIVPLFETGTWSEADGLAVVHFDTLANMLGNIPTGLRPTSVDLSFALSGCTLKLARDPAHAYGAAGLVFAKKSCSN